MTDTQPNQALIDSTADLLWDYLSLSPSSPSSSSPFRCTRLGTMTRGGLAACILRLVDEAYPERAAAPDLLAALEHGAQVNLPDFLDWLADRLVNVYGESPNVDFVHTCRDRAKLTRAAIAEAKREGG